MRKFYTLSIGVAMTALTATAAQPEMSVFGSAERFNAFPLEMKQWKGDAGKEAPEITKQVLYEGTAAAGYRVQATHNVPANRVQREEGEGYVLTFNFTVPVDGKTYGSPRSVDIYGDNGYFMAYATDQSWTIADPVYTDEPVPAGHYGIMTSIDFEGGDLDAGRMAYYCEIDVAEGATSFTIDFTQCTHKIAVNSVMANGEPYPVKLDIQQPGPLTKASYDLYVDTQLLSAGAMYFGFGDAYFLVNDLPENTHFRKYQDVYELGGETGSFYYRDYDGAVTEDIIINVTPQDYALVDSRFVVTEADTADTDFGGYYFDVWNLSANTQFGEGFGGQYADKETPTSLPIYVSLPPIHNPDKYVQETSFSAMVPFDKVEGTYVGKATGYYVNDNGKIWLLPAYYSILRNGDSRSVSYFSPCEWLNIDTEKNPDIVNFSKSVALMGIAMPMFDPNDPTLEVYNFAAQVAPCGPYNDRMMLVDPFKYLSGIKYNGEETTMDDVMGKPGMGATFELTFDYNNQLVNGEIPTSTVVSMGFGIVDFSDIMSPMVGYYNVTDESGKISNSINSEETAQFHVMLADYDTMGKISGNLNVTVSVASQDSDEWHELATTSQTYDCDQCPLVVTAALDHSVIPANAWQKVRVHASDAANNYVDMIIGNCFKYDDGSGVETLGASTAAEVYATYYDLTGRIVENPSTGVYVKVARHADGTTTVAKQVIK